MKSKVYQADWLDQSSSKIDFRKRFDSDHTDTIITRADHLSGHDRSLVLAMYRDGQSAAEIARLGDLDPRQVRRRIRNVLCRLDDPTFIFVIKHYTSWSPTRRKIARSLFQAGCSIRQTAADLDLKVHLVRRHRTAILDLFNASYPLPTPAPNRSWQYPK